MHIKRRHFLYGMGTIIALPWLESLPRPQKTVPGAKGETPKRLVCFGVDLSMYNEGWVPKDSGRNYKLSPLLEPVKEFRDKFTILSGADHPGVTGGHRGVSAFLSGVYKPVRVGTSEVIRNDVTIDQFIATRIGTTNRFESLQFSATNIVPRETLSWNDKGVPLQPLGNASKIFNQLFVNDPNPDRAEQNLLSGKSVLDAVMADAKDLTRQLSRDDHGRVEEYLTGIRDVEKRIERQRQWVRTPKPAVERDNSKIASYHENLDVILELSALALQTDSTRVISVQLTESGMPIIAGDLRVSGYHGQSHHGKDPKVVAELMAIELQHMECLATFMKRLAGMKENGISLFDNTQILFGAGMGNASSHSNRDLPILLAGGGLKHGTHIVNKGKKPLCNLFLTMLHAMDVQVDNFSSSNGSYDSELLA